MVLNRIAFVGLFIVLLALGNPSSAHTHAQAPNKLNVGIVLFPGFELMDVYGPAQMWAYVPDFNVIMVAEQSGPVASAQGVSSLADYSFATAPKLDIVLVPGGFGARAQLDNQVMLDYLTRVHQKTRYTTSVCTGSILLAKVGALDGERATTNKRFFFLSEMQSDSVDWITQARWVESGKVFTSSGVTAGTDMALGLIRKMYGEDWAKGIASGVEYVWDADSSSDPFAHVTNRLLQREDGLVSAMPVVDKTMNNSPRWISLFFQDSPKLSSSRITLTRVDDDTDVPLHGLHTMDNNDLMISISHSLLPGEYRVAWETEFANQSLPRAGGYHFRVNEQ